MDIIKKITNTNYTKSDNRKIEYIVMHYVGAVSTARNNANYFKKKYRGASAHYFVDDNEIVQVVDDKDISWHCGADKYYNEARNTNSIGVEMCCYKKDGKLDISDKVVDNAIELVKELMKKYNIPVQNIVRHYDVTHKVCPAPFVNDESRWNKFKEQLGQAKKNTNVLEWQKVMSKTYKCGLVEDNSYGPDSRAKANKYYLLFKLPTIKNDHVKFIQERLCEHGFITAIDGSYGPHSDKQVRAFQKAKGLKVDGLVGENTTDILLKD